MRELLAFLRRLPFLAAANLLAIDARAMQAAKSRMLAAGGLISMMNGDGKSGGRGAAGRRCSRLPAKTSASCLATVMAPSFKTKPWLSWMPCSLPFRALQGPEF